MSGSGPDRGAFRAAVRRWLAENRDAAPAAPDGPDRLERRFASLRAWQAALHAGGWLGLEWPASYGGRDLGPGYRTIVNQELAAAGAPALVAGWVGVELTGPTLLRFGSEAQCRRLLPGVLSGERIWCQAFSEPESGSDLASVSTRATRDGGHLLIEGTKRWISWASFAELAFVLVRTGAPEARHRALGCVVVPMDAPGLSVAPIEMADGESEECELRFDGVRVPAGNLVGEWDRGWTVLLHNLNLARGPATLSRTIDVQLHEAGIHLALDRLGAEPGDPRWIEAARLHRRLRALGVLGDRKVAAIARGEEPEHMAAVEKLEWAGVSQALADFGVRALGVEGLFADGGTPGGPEWHKVFLRSRANSIEGGTDEIQRQIIARRVLRLPA